MSSHTSSPLSAEEEELFDHDIDMDGNEIGTELEQLGVDLVDQNDLEKSLMAKVCIKLWSKDIFMFLKFCSCLQADKALAERDDELDKKRLEKARKDIA